MTSIDVYNKEISKIRSCVKEFQRDIEKKEEDKQPIIGITNKKLSKQYKNDNPSYKALANYLIGTNRIYTHELILKNKIPRLINKGKNFTIDIQLVSSIDKKIIQTHNKILLKVGLYSWQVPSTLIVNNKKGNQALTGQLEIEMVNGEAHFSSLQINEVTSKFINRVVAILILPIKPCNLGTSLSTSLDYEDEGNVAYHKVRPLLLEKIAVKSLKKKYIDRDDN